MSGNVPWYVYALTTSVWCMALGCAVHPATTHAAWWVVVNVTSGMLLGFAAGDLVHRAPD